MNEVIFIDQRPNQLPEGAWEKLKVKTLELNEVVVLKRHPRFGRTVKTQVGNSLNENKPTATGEQVVYGTHLLSPNRWSVLYNGKQFPVGFDPQPVERAGRTVYKYGGVMFNSEGICVLRGDRAADVEAWKLIQLHSKFKGGIFQTGKQWDFEEDKMGNEEAQDIVAAEEKKAKIKGVVLNLTNEQLATLCVPVAYQREFLNTPNLMSSPLAMKAHVLKLVNTADGIEKVTSALRNLDVVFDIGMIHDMLNAKKLVHVDGSFMLEGKKVFTPTEVISGDSEQVAIGVYNACKSTNNLEWLSAAKGQKAESKKGGKEAASMEGIKSV